VSIWFYYKKAPEVFSPHIWTPFSTRTIFKLGNILKETSAMFIGELLLCFLERNPNEIAENEVSMTCNAP